MGKNIKIFFAVSALFIIFFSFGTDIPNEHRRGFFSDESSYFSITQSLAYDLDIKYKREDIKRIEDYFPGGPTGIYLKKKEGTDDYITYAKPFMYPLFAAPFFRLFGTSGILLFNGLMLYLSILMGYLLLKQYYPPNQSLSFTLIFIFSSVTWIYIWWMTSDLFNFFTLFTALFFFFYPFKNSRWFYVSSVFFTAFVMSKPTNLASVGIIFLILLYRKEWKKFTVLSLICILLTAGLVFFYYRQTGELSPKLYYGGDRTAFFTDYPFDRPGNKFVSHAKTSMDDYVERMYITPEVGALNLFYYFFGRFTGMFIYFFPAFFLLAVFFFRKKIPEDWFILAAIFSSILIACILFAADSYFGGSGSVGNRYFLNIFPLFFFLGSRNRTFKYSVIPVFVAAILLAPTFMDGLFHSYRPRKAGIAFPVNCFPVEKTQFMHLPTNENPRARNLDVGGKYRVYFINDNFHALQNESFWTKPGKEAELLLLAPRKVNSFEVMLQNSPFKNRVTIQIEHKKKRGELKSGDSKVLVFEHIDGLKVSRGYLYQVKVKSSRTGAPDYENPALDDMRHLGVNVHIELHPQDEMDFISR